MALYLHLKKWRGTGAALALARRYAKLAGVEVAVKRKVMTRHNDNERGRTWKNV